MKSVIKVNFTKLLGDKMADGRDYSLEEVANTTGIDRRKLYNLRDLSDPAKFTLAGKLNLKMEEIVALCDFLGCKAGDLIEYTPSPLVLAQQMPAVQEPAGVLA